MPAKKELDLEPQAGDVVKEENGVIYVIHPVTPEQKAELVKKGRIVDAKFLD